MSLFVVKRHSIDRGRGAMLSIVVDGAGLRQPCRIADEPVGPGAVQRCGCGRGRLVLARLGVG
jgi:hypothetical protein